MKMIQLKVYNIVDVRTPEEFAQASIPKPKNINFVSFDNYQIIFLSLRNNSL